LINDYTQLQVLRSITEDTSQPKIAKKIGYSVGKVNFIIKALVEKGFIKVENFSHSNNKLKYQYLLTDEGIKEKISLTKKFIQRKKAEYEELQRELEVDNLKWTSNG
jgi:EPS-associated MarR family transcriptional regulator